MESPDNKPHKILRGWPKCPDCHRPVDHRSMPDSTIGERHWHCIACGIEWSGLELANSPVNNPEEQPKTHKDVEEDGTTKTLLSGLLGGLNW